jgi:tripartite-type tricarboxylate transporter receptor subunit TctC
MPGPFCRSGQNTFLPNVPTFAESGFKDVEADEYFAVFLPSKTPPGVVATLNAAIRTALKAKPMVEWLEKLSFESAASPAPSLPRSFRPNSSAGNRS